MPWKITVSPPYTAGAPPPPPFMRLAGNVLVTMYHFSSDSEQIATFDKSRQFSSLASDRQTNVAQQAEKMLQVQISIRTRIGLSLNLKIP